MMEHELVQLLPEDEQPDAAYSVSKIRFQQMVGVDALTTNSKEIPK